MKSTNYNYTWKIQGNRRMVRKIQRQLVEAFEAGAPTVEKKKRQRKRVCSNIAKVVAIHTVMTNRGGKTPGRDGVVWTKEMLSQVIKELTYNVQNLGEYRTKPRRRVQIPKPGTNERRPLRIPTIMDRCMQALFRLALEPIVENYSDPNSFGFRRERSTWDAICALEYRTGINNRKAGPEFVFETDIEKCFDRISHDWLRSHARLFDKRPLEAWRKTPTVGMRRPTAGTPQGGLISPRLCNRARNGLEAHVEKALGKDPRTGVPYANYGQVLTIRYVDDLVITSKTEKMAKERRPIVEDFLKPRGLNRKEKKTRIVKIREGLEFLGWKLYRDPQKLYGLVKKPTEKSIERIEQSIREITRQANQEPDQRVRNLNLRVNGWGNYYATAYEAKFQVFGKRSRTLFQNVMKWMHKKYPESGRKECYQKVISLRNRRKDPLIDPQRIPRREPGIRQKIERVKERQINRNPFLR